MNNQTNQANFKFKNGDRVFYVGDDSMYIPQDFGTVESIDDGKVWVKWDSDRNTLWVWGHEIVLIEHPNDSQGCSCSQDELTVEKCTEFLSSKGYSVTLTMK